VATSSKLRKTAVVAVDGALAIGTGAVAFVWGAGSASAMPPTPGWTSTQAPLPGAPHAPAADPAVGLDGLSCSSAVFCVASGEYSSSAGNDQALLETYSGGTWTANPAPLPGDAAAPGSDDSFLKSVDCPSDGSCVAVGAYDNSSGREVAFMDTLTSGIWSTMEAPLPADAATGSSAGAVFKDVSCSSVGVCTAVGDYDNSTGDTVGLIDSLSSGAWTSLAAPQPAGAAANHNVDLDAVSCPSAGNCVVAGMYLNSVPTETAEVLNQTNGTWAAQDAPLPANAGTGSALDSDLGSLSCASGTCEAGGEYQDNGSPSGHRGLLERFSGGAWSATEAPEPANAGTGTNQFGSINEVSCTGDGACAAVGSYGDTSGDERGLVESLVNGVPTAAEALQPTDAAATPSTDIDDVSCVAAGECVATGTYEDSSGSGHGLGLIDTETRGTWSSMRAPLPTGAATGAATESNLSGVDCTVHGVCVAAGAFQDTAAHSLGVFETLTPNEGYWEVASDGGIFTFGNAQFHGSTGAIHLNMPIVGMAPVPGNDGYWLVASDGGIFSFGSANFFGSTGAIHLNKPIVGMAATRDGQGYWLVASDGGIFSFGDAQFYGSTGAIHLNKPIVGMAATPSGHGYWLVASDGGIFSFGDAQFYGSTGALTLNKPVVGIAATPSGHGYWLVASDGGVFTFGDAPYEGSTGAIKLNKPIVGLLSTFDGQGYWEVASDGGIFAQGDTGFLGSEGGTVLNKPVVNGAAT
jgi:hypothetical protein